MPSFLTLLACIALVALLCVDASERSKEHQKVTCGSAIKLTHVTTNFRLHSHDINQSVTAYPEADDPNSLFLVEAAFGKHCKRGEPVKCGGMVRLMHINTKAFLHSHLHQAPLSQQQEVSAYAEKNGGDDWEVVCVDKSGDGKQWMRDAQVRLKHRETEHYLSTSKSYAYRSPIPGQLEVSAVGSSGKDTLWKAQEGIYFSDDPVLS